MQFSPVLVPFAVSAVILVSLALYELSARKTLAVPFGALMIMCAVWSLLYALEIGSTDVAAKILYMKLNVIPPSLISVLWLVLAFHFTGRADWLTPGRVVVFMIEPVIAVALTLTSGGSGSLFRSDFHLDPTGISQVILCTNGILFYVHLLYLYGLLLSGLLLIASSVRARQSMFRRQAWLMIAGMTAPMIVNLLFHLRIFEWHGINFTPVVSLTSGIGAAIALFRFHWLDMMPIADSLVVQTLDDIMLIFDPHGLLVEFNLRARGVIGFDPRVTVGHPLDELPLPWPSALAPYAGRTSARGRVDIKTHDGARSYDLTLSPIRDRLGRSCGKLLILHDVTERALAEEELRLSRERLQLAFENASDGMWDWDVPTGRMYWSPRFYTMLGYVPGEIESGFASWKSLAHPDDLDHMVNELDDIIRRRRESHALEFRLRARDGGWRWVLCRGRAVSRDAEGDAVRVIGTNVDITERREVEERLRESEEKFRSFIEQAQDAIMLIDGEGKIAEYNPAAEKLSGVWREEAIGNPIWTFIERTMPHERWTSEYRTHLKERYISALRHGEGDILGNLIEGVLTQPNGAMRSFQQILFPIRTKSGFWIGSISHDVTEITRAEEALRKSRDQLMQAQKMEAVGRLAGGIAHDFNNLLTVIGGYGDLVLDGLPDTSRLKEDMREVMMAAQRASTLTSQLLAFSRKQVLQPKVISVNELVRIMGKMLRRLIGEDIELATLLSHEMWNIKADPGQIEQVIMNLAVNARDAMPRGGTLTIATSNVAADEPLIREHPEMKPGEYAVISVSDTGQGMDAETLGLIFEPFFTTKETGKGTGLGLPTAYGIIKQSGGYIYCESEQGIGTRFTLYFPRCTLEPIVEAVETGRRHARAGTETILLAEDEDSVRGFTMTVLKNGGYQVIAVPGGLEALSEISHRKGEIHLLLTDVVMPKMSGIELAQKAQEIHPGIRVLYVSGYAQDAAVNRGVLDHEVDFIQKPFSAETLLAKIREILDRRDRG